MENNTDTENIQTASVGESTSGDTSLEQQYDKLCNESYQQSRRGTFAMTLMIVLFLIAASIAFFAVTYAISCTQEIEQLRAFIEASNLAE